MPGVAARLRRQRLPRVGFQRGEGVLDRHEAGVPPGLTAQVAVDAPGDEVVNALPLRLPPVTQVAPPSVVRHSALSWVSVDAS